MIKREARILGLAAHKVGRGNIVIVGAIYRGSLWLDAVFVCKVSSKKSEYLRSLVEAVVHSKQYSQIQTAILAKEFRTLVSVDISELSRRLNLPVILLARPSRRENERHIQDRHGFKSERRNLHIRFAGLNTKESRELFEIGCLNGQGSPEAVKVAKIIATQMIIGGWNNSRNRDTTLATSPIR